MTELAVRLAPHQLLALAIGGLACAWDLSTRRIPNAITLGGAGIALAYALIVHGPKAMGISALGWLAGLAVFLPFYLLRGMGAGDVKLIACFGAWLGPSMAVWTALYGALAGGVMGVVVMLTAGQFASTVGRLNELILHFRTVGVRPHPTLTLTHSKGPRLPYALPITAGALAAIWLQ